MVARGRRSASYAARSDVRGAAGEDDSVLEGLAGTLSEVGSHRVRGIADQGDPVLDVGGQRRKVVEVVVQEVGLVCLFQQRRDGIVPVAEPVGGAVARSPPSVPSSTFAVAKQ